MVDKIIQEQLNKVQYADLSNFDEATNTYIIKKRKDLQLEEDHYYLIQIKNEFLNNCKSDVVTINWNAGRYPKYQFYRADIMKVMGKMVRINGTAVDSENREEFNDSFTGWLPLNCIIVLEEI